MRIGIYTFHAHHNVGAMLQTFATVKFLEKCGVEPEIVNLYPKSLEDKNHHHFKICSVRDVLRYFYLKFHRNVKLMEQKFDSFHQALPLSKRYYSNEAYMDYPIPYDVHLIGSDQVWNLQKGYEYSRFYFLDYLPVSFTKVSFASSFGTTEIVRDVDKVKEALSKFDFLSAREDKAVDFIKSLTGKSCIQILDPTLLLSNEDWNQFVSSEPYINGKYILFYGVNKDDNTWQILKTVQKFIDAPIVGYPGPNRPYYKFDRYITDGGPLDFVNLIKHAAYIVTSSFHGLAFAVNYNKKFMLVKYGERMERMESLVRLLNIEDHYINNPKEAAIFLENDVNVVSQEKLNIERQKAKLFLANIFATK